MFQQYAFKWMIAVTALAASTPSMASPDCAEMQRLRVRGVTVTKAELVSGSFAPPTGRGLTNLPPFCRVAGAIKPSPGSYIRFEVWMPIPGWTGRFQGVGNFGFGGELSYETMAGALRRGDAVASTDTGHESSDWMSAVWAPGHPARVVDFGYRAIHETAVAAKTFIRAFYGSKPTHSYFSSCSNGGRQALMEAQRYPTDYDGIIAGAPAHDFTRLLAHGAWLVNVLLRDEAGHLPAEKLRPIQAAALAACDRLDGVRDGIIGEPESCRPRLASLLCAGADGGDCLTRGQLASVEKLYSGSRTATGRTFLPGNFPGGEAEPGGWAHWLTGPPATLKVTYGGPSGTTTWRTQAPVRQTLAYGFATQFFSNMVFEKHDWDIFSFNLDRDSKTADDKLAALLNATDADLAPFQARGGKLLLYHGWNDAGVPPLGTVQYYQRIVEKAGPSRAEDFVRLFMVPGMQHCSGGSGATFFGQVQALGPSAGPAGDADHDILTALERWVENGVSPRTLVAVKRKNDADPKSNVLGSRRLCPYPLVAKYTGSGSTDDASNFVCRASGQ